MKTIEKSVVYEEKSSFKISGIKCDFCTWRDDSIQFEDYPKYINASCPECKNSPLLTSEEYEKSSLMYKAVEIAGKINNVIKWLNPLHYWRLLTGKKAKLYRTKKEFKYRAGTPNYKNK